jgi:hypothetical protein
MRWIIPLLIAVSLSVPAASAWSAEVLLKMDSPSKFVMEAEATIDGEDASDLRGQMDQYGNGDGTVQAAEVETIEGFFKQFMDQSDAEDADDSLGAGFTIDGKSPNSFKFNEMDIQDAEGAVSSTSPIHALIKAEMGFDVQPADKHTIRLMAGDDSGDDESGSSGDFFEDVESAKLRAAPGYIFTSTEGLPAGAKVSGDKKEIEFADSVGPTSGETVIVMSKGGPAAGGNSPGPALGAFAIVLVGAVWAARRRFGQQ